jgi:hypothetical protein
MSHRAQIPPLPFRGRARGGACQDAAAFADSPHPNPSPEGVGGVKSDLLR